MGLQCADYSLVYSGDTRPCDPIVQLGLQLGEAGARLAPGHRVVLVHEATFDDSSEQMQQEAVQRHHSTVGEALEIGRRMGAWRVILTHFSQRFPKLADVRDSPTDGAVIAFDGMRVPFSLLPELPQLTPSLLCMFAAELEGDDK